MDKHILMIHVGHLLLDAADPSRGGSLIVGIKALRGRMHKEYGYVLPLVRVKDNPNIWPYQFLIYANQTLVFKKHILPSIQMPTSDDDHSNPCEDFYLPAHPLEQYLIWQSMSGLQTDVNSHITEVIILHLEQTALQYADLVLLKSHSKN